MSTATLGGKRFRLDPTKVTWSYEIRTSERETLGGKVVQIFGAEISDITIEGSFGVGGWKEQAEWLEYIATKGEEQATGNLPTLQFVYAHLGIDEPVYIKSFRQPEGSSVTLANEIPAPRWIITLVSLDKEHGLIKLQDASILGYMKRLSEGVGWQQTEYNGPKDAADLLRLIGSNNLEGARLFYAKRAEPVTAAALAAIGAQISSLSASVGAPGTGGATPITAVGVPGGPSTPVPAGVLSLAQVIGVASQAGFSGMALAIAGAIAMRESGGDPKSFAHPPQYPRDLSYGLWQINMLGNLGPPRLVQYGLSSNEQLFDPVINARVAFKMSGGGTNWKPWSTYNSGVYLKDLPAARQIVGV